MITKFKDISRQLLASLLAVSGAGREHLWMNYIVLELGWGCIIDQKWPQYMGRFVRYHPVIVT
jgi:hypothetical protein